LKQLEKDRKLALNPFPNSFLPPPPPPSPPLPLPQESEELEDYLPLYSKMSKPKRYKFSSNNPPSARQDDDDQQRDESNTTSSSITDFEVGDTFVIDFLTGRGRFVGIEGKEEEEREGEGEGDEKMDVEV